MNFRKAIDNPLDLTSDPRCVAIGDFNNDTWLDFVVTNSGTNNIVMFFGQSNGEFSNQKLLPTGIRSHPNSIVAGHFNNDQQLDIAVANYGTNNIGIFWNMSNGTFVKQTLYMLDNASPYFIDVTDVNKDKQPDLIAVSRGTNSINILVGRGGTHFLRPTMFASGSISSISAAIGDLNKDGLPDIIAINDDTNSVTISLSGNERFQSETRYSNILELNVLLKRTIDDGSNDEKVRAHRTHT